MNKNQWNFKRNSYIFIHENASDHVVCEMAVILSRPQCVKLDMASHAIRRLFISLGLLAYGSNTGTKRQW